MSKAQIARNLINSFTGSKCCPAHRTPNGIMARNSACHGSTDAEKQNLPDYAYEISNTNFRFGLKVTQELAYDLDSYGARNTMVLTDPTLSHLPPFRAVLDTLTRHKMNYTVFDRVHVEPTDTSMMEAIEFARKGDFDSFVGVGGGSTMDTAKMASLYSANSDANFWDYVARPFGLQKRINKPMKTLICVPTTAGTGSECTGITIFELTNAGKNTHVKTGIRHRQLFPRLALVDPEHVKSMPQSVATFSGFDVLCHALESFTLLPFDQRTPRPTRSSDRPLLQGRNPFTDAWAREGLRLIAENFKESIKNPENIQARENMMLASSIAGMGFGNAGTHLCHGLGYVIAGAVKTYKAPQYPQGHPLVPHGLSVCLTAPADFEFTGPACPDRHLEAAELLGHDITGLKEANAGNVLADVIRKYMQDLDVPNGLNAIEMEGCTADYLAQKAENIFASRQLIPRSINEEQIAKIFDKSWTVY